MAETSSGTKDDVLRDGWNHLWNMRLEDAIRTLSSGGSSSNPRCLTLLAETIAFKALITESSNDASEAFKALVKAEEALNQVKMPHKSDFF